jgi:hypothetical protein
MRYRAERRITAWIVPAQQCQLSALQNSSERVRAVDDLNLSIRRGLIFRTVSSEWSRQDNNREDAYDDADAFRGTGLRLQDLMWFGSNSNSESLDALRPLMVRGAPVFAISTDAVVLLLILVPLVIVTARL